MCHLWLVGCGEDVLAHIVARIERLRLWCGAEWFLLLCCRCLCVDGAQHTIRVAVYRQHCVLLIDADDVALTLVAHSCCAERYANDAVVGCCHLRCCGLEVKVRVLVELSGCGDAFLYEHVHTHCRFREVVDESVSLLLAACERW